MSTMARAGVGEMKMFGGIVKDLGISATTSGLQYATNDPRTVLDVANVVGGHPNPLDTADTFSNSHFCCPEVITLLCA